MNGLMKGRVKCPNCSTQFTAKAEKGIKKLTVDCPNCKHKFNVKISFPDSGECFDESLDKEECTWEEHGEPRKTILSSIKPRTDKPMFVAFFLSIVFIIALVSAFSTETFVETPTSIISLMGVKGSLEFLIVDSNNTPVEGIYVNMDDDIHFLTDFNGSVTINNINIGNNDIWISYNSTNNNENYPLTEVFVFAFISSYYELKIDADNSPPTVEKTNANLTWCSIIIIILSIICLIGAISAWKRKHFDIVVFGSIIGIFTIGIFFIGTIFSIISLILLFYSKEEFEDGKKGKSF